MTQPDYDDDLLDDQDDDGSRVTLTRSQIRAMERDAKEARKAREETDALRRELAFARAGGEFTERQQRALLASIDGDVTAENIRSAAEELGFIAPSPASPQAEEQGAMDRIANAASGSPEDANDDPIARLHRADREGGKEAVLAEIQRQGHVVTAGA